jgi:ribosomal-protein-alanine N-acetyltransferase
MSKIIAIHIRRMNVEDVPDVFALDLASFTLPWSERSFQYEVTGNENARCWVAENSQSEGGQVAAMLIIWLILDEAHIATLAVLPEFRRKGIASWLLRSALNEAYNEGARQSYLEVRAGNQVALQMYEKLGFKVVGSRPHYYHDNNEDALLMTLENLKPIAIPPLEY